MKFSELSINPHLISALEEMNIQEPSEVQSLVFEDVKAGRDVMGISKTGSGKTLAYLLPSLQQILEGSEKSFMLILEPTRELVQQVCSVSEQLVSKLNIEVVKICGGETLEWIESDQHKVVVATPGRLLKAIDQKEIELTHFKNVVIDEVDQFFNQGFMDVLQDLISRFQTEHQSLMFSATMPASVETFSKQFLIHPKVVNLSSKDQLEQKVIHHFQLALPNHKPDAFRKHLKDIVSDQVLVFCNTKFIAERLFKQWQYEEKSLDWLHGDMEQVDRNKVFKAFQNKEIKILITTDVAARGLDIQDLGLVVNYDFPLNRESFVHRSGRTGRMGKGGHVVSFIRPEELPVCKEVLDQLNLKPDWVGGAPDFKEVEAMKYKAKQRHKGPASPKSKRYRNNN